MEYLSVSKIAAQWGIPERTVRNYCALGKIPGAFLTGKTWNIPENATHPRIKNPTTASKRNLLLTYLQEQKAMKLKGGIYHRTQVELTYNSNRIEGSKLSQEQTRYIFETNTIGEFKGSINLDDIIETTNHFKCIDLIIDHAKTKLSEKLIKEIHYLFKSGTSDSTKEWFKVGEYKKLPNEVGGNETTPPEEVPDRMKELLSTYHSKENKTLEDILDFHHQFELIHPFQDGNGRVGRLIMFKECLANDIVPFIIGDDIKFFYYRGLQQWGQVNAYLTDTCLSAQDQFKTILQYFKIDF